MAKFGARYPAFKPSGAEKGVVIGKLVAANLTVNLASGELYADDILAEQLSQFASGNVAMETDDMVDEVASVVYGCKVVDKTVTYNINDVAPRGGLAYYVPLRRSGTPGYKGIYYPQASASLGNDNTQTRGSSITFQTTNTAFTIFADEKGDWRETETLESADDAIAWINGKCDIETPEPPQPQNPPEGPEEPPEG